MWDSQTTKNSQTALAVKNYGGKLVLKLLTTHAKTTEMANDELPAPSSKPIAVARAITVAECDDGMPPDPNILLESHL